MLPYLRARESVGVIYQNAEYTKELQSGQRDRMLQGAFSGNIPGGKTSVHFDIHSDIWFCTASNIIRLCDDISKCTV
jgi:hypothetical protein